MAPSRGACWTRLLDDETIEIIGVTGTSAGAMNGAVLVDGLVRGERLRQFVFFEHVMEFGNCSERLVRALGACQADQQLGQLRKILQSACRGSTRVSAAS